jgi:hypothetical protein
MANRRTAPARQRSSADVQGTPRRQSMRPESAAPRPTPAGATDALRTLINGVCTRLSISVSEIGAWDGINMSELRRQLQSTKGGLARRARARISAAKNVADRKGVNPKGSAETIAFALLAQSHAELDPGRKLAAAEAALWICERSPAQTRPPWIPATRRYVDSACRKGIEPDWPGVFGSSGQQTCFLLDAARHALFSSKFVPGVPRNMTVSITPASADSLDIPFASSPSPTRIDKLDLSGFRAVPGSISLSLANNASKDVSLVLSGDNGVGKSSLVSAIEFACQARIGRVAPLRTRNAVRPVHLERGAGQASVVVRLSDGRVIERSIDLSEDGRSVLPNSIIIPEFRLVPMSLQRAEIVTFLGLPPSERGKLFVEHFDIGRRASGPSPAVETLREDQVRLKAQRRAIFDDLVQRAGARPRQGPLNQQFAKLISLVFLDGLTASEWKARGDDIPHEARSLISHFERISAGLAGLKRDIADSGSPDKVGIWEMQVRRLSELLGDIGRPLTEAVKFVGVFDEIARVDVHFARQSALSIELEVGLRDGRVVPPESVFSEGFLDLLAILFFVQVAKAAALRGQAQILILDDVVQSVDSTVRVRLIDYILQDLATWQLIITVHDLGWRAQLTDRMRKANHPFVIRHIRRWSFGGGPVVVDETGDGSQSLRGVVGKAASSTVAAESGRLIEAMSDRLSWTLPVAVSRARDDRYDLGALWPPVLKKLKKTNLSHQAQEVDRWIHLRNLLGAHHNEVATSLPDSDADEFAKAVLGLWDGVFCSSCLQWVEREGPSSPPLSCPCGQTKVVDAAGPVRGEAYRGDRPTT